MKSDEQSQKSNCESLCRLQVMSNSWEARVDNFLQNNRTAEACLTPLPSQRTMGVPWSGSPQAGQEESAGGSGVPAGKGGLPAGEGGLPASPLAAPVLSDILQGLVQGKEHCQQTDPDQFSCYDEYFEERGNWETSDRKDALLTSQEFITLSPQYSLSPPSSPLPLPVPLLQPAPALCSLSSCQWTDLHTPTCPKLHFYCNLKMTGAGSSEVATTM